MEEHPTGKGVADFLTTVANRGDMNANTAGAMKAAVKEVLSSVHNEEWETVDVSKIDLDTYADRFARLRASKFKSASLKVYQSRFKNAIEMYMAWRANPAEWKYKAERPYADRKAKVQAASQRQERKGSHFTGSNGHQAPDPDGVNMVDYPYPLRKGLLVTLRLPDDLTKQEASRLRAYVDSLAIDERPALGPGGSAQ